ncbi:MAG: diaminopimelate epimerase [Methylococcales bacterium]|nr:diaminopimelate epimerase [Methylococcales bacterium]
MRVDFTKMHGLGNDFIVIDATETPVSLTPEIIQTLAHRHFGIGYDQVLIIEPPSNESVDFKYRIFNADGGEVFQCGNGARCFARFVFDKKLSKKDKIIVETGAGKLVLHQDNSGFITVNMGIPIHNPVKIPVQATEEARFYSVNVQGTERALGAVSMGNPHAVMEVKDIKSAQVEVLGSALESHSFFPDRANIGFMQVVNRHYIKLRVYERGAAETLACGSGACAAVVIGIERKLLDPEVKVRLLGGMLAIKWEGRGKPVFMKGPAVSVFEGYFEV